MRLEPPCDADLTHALERRRLAHELHDIVTHHLANVALCTMGRHDQLDADGLRAVLGEVNEAAASALVELRLLARVIGDPAAPGEPLADLSRDVRPSAAATSWRRRLTEAGLVAGCTVPPAADRLARSVQSTLARTFEATGAAMVRLAAAGSRCSAVVRVEPTRVLVRVTAAPPGGLGTTPTPELDALRARLDLTHGRLDAGVGDAGAGTRWAVTVVVPLD